MFSATFSDKEFQGNVIHVETASRKVPAGGFGRRGGKFAFYLCITIFLHSHKHLYLMEIIEHVKYVGIYNAACLEAHMPNRS